MSKKSTKPQTKVVPKKKTVTNNSNKNSAPISSSILLVSKAPKINNGKRFTVSHTEFITPVIVKQRVSNVAFSLFKRFRINPGSALTFSWLSSIALSFEFYRFKKLKFHYITRSPTTRSDSLIMSPDYDASEGVSVDNEKNIFNNTGTTDDVVWKNQTITMNNQLMNRMYSAHTVMSDGRFATTKQDQKTVDAAQLSIYIEALNAEEYTAGKLLVEYEVEFWAPQNASEISNQGGMVMNTEHGNGVINPSSVRPLDAIQTSVAEVNDAIVGRIIQPSNEFSDLMETPHATAVLGRFLKDYQGVIDLNVSGATVDLGSKLFKSSLAGLNSSAGDVQTDLPLRDFPGSNQFRSTDGTKATGKFIVDALKGELLKVSTANAVDINNIETVMGGFASPFLGWNNIY